MSDIIEGMGTAVEGSLQGGTIEPATGNAPSQTASGQTCLNCAAPLNGTPYCPNCGQKVQIHRTLSAIFHDLIHGVLHLDGKFWLTLPLLVFRPGQLTRRYIEGERAKFVSPMAMFLFSVFAMFAVFQMIGLTTPTDLAADTRTQVTGLIETETAALTAEIAELDAELTAPEVDASRRAALQAERGRLELDLAELESRKQNLSQWLESDRQEIFGTVQSAGESELAAAQSKLATLPEGSDEHKRLAAQIASAQQAFAELERFQDMTQVDVPVVRVNDMALTIDETGVPIFDTLLEKWNANPSLMLYKLQANGYKFSWLLIPLSIPFVWVLFAWRRRFKAYDHAIFVTYSLSFMSLLFIVTSLIAVSSLDKTGGLAFMIFAIAAPLHVYKHLKYTYDLSPLSTLWRFYALLHFIVIILVLFLQLLLLLGTF